jgi:hypothetical protein
MTPAEQNLTIYKGDTFYLPLTFTDSLGEVIDISTYVFKGQIKTSMTAITSLAEFTFQFATDGSDGVVTASLTHLQTTDLTSGVYDIQATVGDVVQTYLYGKVRVAGEVTK